MFPNLMKRSPFPSPILIALCATACGLSPLGQIVAADKPLSPEDLFSSPFGIGSCHINNVSAQSNAKWVPRMTAIGISNERTCSTGWNGVEPEEGKWNWEALDAQMDYLESQHMMFGGILAGNPKWNVKDPKGLPVNNLAGWSRYVSELVKHVHGRIKYWEVWNEPPNGTGKDQTAADYAKIVMAAYDAAKAADPACKVGIAAKSVAITYLDQAIAAGAKGHFDYVTLHPYEVGGCVMTYPGTEAVYLQIAGTLRKMLAARDPAKVNCPLVLTEIGYAASGPYNKLGPDAQGQALVKYYAMGIAQGMTCIQWFEAMDGDSGPMGLMEKTGTPRNSFTALTQMVALFGQHPTCLGWLLLNDKHYGFVFQGAKGTVLATWAATKTPDNVNFGQPVRIIEPLTGNAIQSATYALTTGPIFVDGVPDKIVQIAKANKGKPFTWNGDYTGAKSVSVTFGEKNVEKGLHTKSAESIAADVLAYGGSARAGTVPGGNVFMVDPNFLSYTTTPIEISVVIRRNEANDPAKLTLTYESTSGYKKAEPFEVPDNKEWSTAKWKIDDAQFVSQWAYNFTFNSGKYVVQSVTVTKLAK